MNAGPFAPVLARFSRSWAAHSPNLAVLLQDTELTFDDSHPLRGELLALCSGRAASLPFFTERADVTWCTVAPNQDSLKQAVAALHAWVLPSFGGERKDDGYVQPGSAR